MESVTVPYGTFNAIHVSFNLTVSTVVEGVTFTVPWVGDVWFAKGIGIVKRSENGVTFNLTNYSAIDSDGDGIPDIVDAFPNNPAESVDTDSDGIGNNADPDDDNDGYPDTVDALPLNPAESLDTDGDGIGNNADLDDDGDGYPDTMDVFPLDRTEWVDTDGDGIGNNADPDDDNDGYPDATDAFPLDPTEWLDTDGDGIGNNADPNDDNDRLADIDDPRPLDPNAPGFIYSVSRGVAVAGKDTKVIVSGDYLSNEDSFFIDGAPLNKTVLSKNAVELLMLNPTEGQHTLSIQYSGHSYASSTTISVKAPIYYPYAVVSIGGTKAKGYYDPTSESLYDYNSSLSQITRYQYVTGGGWATTPLTITNLRSMAVSPDLKHLYALRTGSLIEINKNNFSVGASISLISGVGTILSDLEFDYANNAVMVTDYQGSGSTPVYFYNAEPQSSSFGAQHAGNYLYNSAIGASGDGTLLVLGESGLSPVQPLVQYRPILGIFTDLTVTESYFKADINTDGSKILINNHNIYNNTFSLIGQLSSYVSAAAMDPAGQFIVAADSAGNLNWYDTGNLTGQVLTPSYSSAITENVGSITELILSHDGLTLFVLGTNKTLVIPVWQIVENAIGSPLVCPSAGCGGIQVSQGVPAPGTPNPVIPPFDTLASPIKHISPTYTGEGNQIEVLLTGAGFLPASVVQFGNTLATNIRYVNDTEMRATIPVLPAGNYTVTVDGHLTNAPSFDIIAQQPITPASWAIGGYPIEMIYDARKHALYSLDTSGMLLSRINLSDNTTISQSIANAKDLTWCPADGFLYVATGVDFRQYNAQTLQYVKTMAITAVDRLECVSENNIVLTAENQWQEYKLFYGDTGTLVGSLTFAGYPAGSLYSPTVDGVSSRGDRVYFGESGISSISSVLFTPHLLSSSIIYNTSGFSTSSWSDSGSIGILNNSAVYNYDLSNLGSISVSGVVVATTVSPDATKIFAVTSDAVVHVIRIDPANPIDFTEDASFALTSNVGPIVRIESSLDGHTVFVGGNNGIEALTVD